MGTLSIVRLPAPIGDRQWKPPVQPPMAGALPAFGGAESLEGTSALAATFGITFASTLRRDAATQPHARRSRPYPAEAAT